MAIESATTIPQFDANYPQAVDLLTEGDDHIRLLKAVLKNQLGSLGNTLLTVTAAQLNNIINLAAIASPTFTGVPRAPTPAPSAAGTEIATMAALASAIAAAVLTPGTLPPVAGLADKFLYNDGTTVGWDYPGSRGYILVRDEKASGTNGGANAAATSNIRTLNTVVRNSLAGASLAANRVTVPAGSYLVRARCPATGATGAQKAGLYNVTAATFVATGGSSFGLTGAGSEALLLDVITLAAQSDLELRHYTNTLASGAGALGTATSTGQAEVYAWLELVRIG